MDVCLSAERQMQDKDNDLLAISLTLKKGSIHAIWLKDIRDCPEALV